MREELGEIKRIKQNRQNRYQPCVPPPQSEGTHVPLVRRHEADWLRLGISVGLTAHDLHRRNVPFAAEVKVPVRADATSATQSN